MEKEESMALNIEFTEQTKRECAEALSKVPDTSVLYLKTHNFTGTFRVGNSAVFI